MYPNVKRIIDFNLAFIALLILLPILLVISLLIKVDSRGPVMFTQQRVGRKRQPFDIYKFRTMRIDTPNDVPTCRLENPKAYITGIGSFLRKTSLDELPQLINILKGDMSFIGPRPVVLNELDLVNQRERYGANDALPGITGLAQINGRDELSSEIKAKYDGKYVNDICFVTDLKILLKTILYVLQSKGVIEGASLRNVDRSDIRNKHVAEKKTGIR
ncbi:sugar transferase [Aquibacillus sediminis]|uniref:sugar transferase n=1 Tax=Aquibacillus sediminis TaxID=2574734 RepID=UPI001109048B|nr:sugar transferase [Aquibacillus sediminis]